MKVNHKVIYNYNIFEASHIHFWIIKAFLRSITKPEGEPQRFLGTHTLLEASHKVFCPNTKSGARTQCFLPNHYIFEGNHKLLWLIKIFWDKRFWDHGTASHLRNRLGSLLQASFRIPYQRDNIYKSRNCIHLENIVTIPRPYILPDSSNCR